VSYILQVTVVVDTVNDAPAALTTIARDLRKTPIAPGRMRQELIEGATVEIRAAEDDS
jgi:hypothetical protein